ncbi:MAG: LacI family DNA-binding transcriptional regulator [Rubripirellula sp.]|nr:LacI family DNA-binding transcriptional regulator [Rubripirellula sp.]
MNSFQSNPVSLKEVANAAGVSVSTASRALNGKANECRISETTETAVQQAAKRLGFRPSRVAQSLRSQRTGLFGAIVPDVANPFFAAIAREITVAAEHSGYSLLLADSHDSTDVEHHVVRQLWQRRIEALLICPVGLVSDHLAELDRAGMPVVLIDRGFCDGRLMNVTSDHQCGAAELTKLLTNQGHTRIGVLQGHPGTLPNDERLAGIRQALIAAGTDLNPKYVRGDQFGEASGYDATRRILGQHPEITALIGLSSENTLGALRAIAEVGLRIPDDLSLVTFDDHPFADYLATPLTTACQDMAELGRLASTLIIDRIESGKRLRKKMHRVPMRIIERASIAKPKQSSHFN